MEHATQQLALVEELGNARGTVEAATNLSLIYYDQGDQERARILLEETVAQARELGLREELGDAMLNLAVLLLEQGHVARAENMFREVAEQRRSEADPGAGAWPLARLGSIALDRGDLDQAESTLREAVILARDHGHVVPLMGSLYSLAEVAVMAGDAERAARLYGAEEREGERLGRLSPPRLRETRQHFLDRGQESIGEHAWQRAWDEGRAMSLEEAIEYALDEAER
jgi:non-specific serine/threonine protein kinase